MIWQSNVNNLGEALPIDFCVDCFKVVILLKDSLMIAGIFMRGYKAFDKITYVPITEKAKFSAFIGDNGAGKSSILEALDTFFNNERFNRNKTQQKRGQSRLEDVAFAAPIFILTSEEIKNLSEDQTRLLKAISKYLKNIPSSHSQLAELKNHLSEIENIEEYFVVGLARYSDDKTYQDFLINTGLHNHIYRRRTEYDLTENDFGDKVGNDRPFKHLNSLRAAIIKQYSYIYIPVEANEEDFSKLESKTVERLSDNDLFQDISRIVDAKKVSTKINTHLDTYLNEIEQNLDGLKYHSAYRIKFTYTLLVEKIIEGYFSTKILHQGDPKVPISDLSAGEKRQALLAFSTALLERASAKTGTFRKVVFALDEPESSLHISRVFGQIERLKAIAQNCAQVLITTHWYGFIPVLDEGWVHSLTQEANETEIDSINLENFYHQTRNLKSNTKGERPLDANLKGNSELVQSIINSTVNETPYTWIICEGCTDAIYLKSFLNINNIRIIPVAGARNVIKLYKLLHPVVDDYRDRIKAPILCLIDTDDELPKLEGIQTSIPKKLLFRRLCNDPRDHHKTILVNESSTLAGPTAIEDVLPPKLYIKVLETYKDELGFNPKDKKSTGNHSNSYQCLDLKTSERTKLKDFFNREDGNNKILFANSFCDAYKETPEDVSWREELTELLSK